MKRRINGKEFGGGDNFQWHCPDQGGKRQGDFAGLGLKNQKMQESKTCKNQRYAQSFFINKISAQEALSRERAKKHSYVLRGKSMRSTKREVYVGFGTKGGGGPFGVKRIPLPESC